MLCVQVCLPEAEQKRVETPKTSVTFQRTAFHWCSGYCLSHYSRRDRGSPDLGQERKTSRSKDQIRTLFSKDSLELIESLLYLGVG
jgi:hypothetical protein